MWSPLFLFFYHKADKITRICYQQLCDVEGKENVIPVSSFCKDLPNTFYLKDLKDYFFQSDDAFASHIMYDGFIYKYVLHNKEFILTKDVIVTVEYDTWWNYSSNKWLKWLIKEYDILGPKIVIYEGDPDWMWFNFKIVDKLNIPKSQLLGLMPLAVTCSKPEYLIKISNFVKDNAVFHYLINCELRFGTAARLVGAKIGELPFKRTIHSLPWDAGAINKQREGIFHPVKYISQFKFD